MSRAGETAVVTGAAGALGAAIAERLAADGYRVAVLDVDAEGASAVADRIRTQGGTAVGIGCDLRDPGRISRAFRRSEEELGPVGVLVNNAAVFPAGPFVDVTLEELDDTTAVNQRAYFLCAQHAARSMIAAGRGSIVNIASVVVHGFWADMSPYVATKGAIVALTRALARELGPAGIRVNAVAPGAFPTAAERAQHADPAAYERRVLDSQSLKRRGTPEELAAAVAFLAGDEASFVTGQTLTVDGGWVMR